MSGRTPVVQRPAGRPDAPKVAGSSCAEVVADFDVTPNPLSVNRVGPCQRTETNRPPTIRPNRPLFDPTGVPPGKQKSPWTTRRDADRHPEAEIHEPSTNCPRQKPKTTSSRRFLP